MKVTGYKVTSLGPQTVNKLGNDIVSNVSYRKNNTKKENVINPDDFGLDERRLGSISFYSTTKRIRWIC